MRLVSIILLVGVFLRHVAVNWLNFGISQTSLFYTFGGVWEALLCLVIFGLVGEMKHSIWRTFILYAMVIGIIEGVQMTVCRPLVLDLAKVPPGWDMCDYLLGFRFGKWLEASYYVVLVCIVGRAFAKRTS